MELKLELKGIDKVLSMLEPSKTRKAVARTLNELGSNIQTQSVKEVRKIYNVKADGLKSKLEIKPANEWNLKWSMTVPGDKKLNLIHFGARQVKKGVSVKVLTSGPRKVIKGAFIANGGNTVFKRKGKERLPIKTVTGLSPSQMISQRLRDRKLDEAQRKAPDVFKRNFNYYITKN